MGVRVCMPCVVSVDLSPPIITFMLRPKLIKMSALLVHVCIGSFLFSPPFSSVAKQVTVHSVAGDVRCCSLVSFCV